MYDYCFVCAVLASPVIAQGVENKRCYELNEEEINKIREEVGKYTTEADLVREAGGGGGAGCQRGAGAAVAETRTAPGQQQRAGVRWHLYESSRRHASARPSALVAYCARLPHVLVCRGVLSRRTSSG